MRIRTIILGVLGTATLATVAVHIPMFLHRAGVTASAGGCPFGYDKVAKGPTKHDPKLRGTTPAGARPALGFTLDVSSRADVTAWAAAHGATCGDHHGEMECRNIADGGLPLEAAWFKFNNLRGTLDQVRTMRRGDGADVIAKTFSAVEADVTAHAGEPMKREGSPEAVALAAGLMRQAMVEYRFTDYRAVVRATNLGANYALTEEYTTMVD